jgi:hypothetical protein
MSTYLGDFQPGITLDHKFTTVTTTGAPTQLAGTPAISIYKDNDTTQTTTGVTLTVDFDSVTGLNNVRVVTTDSFYVAGANYSAVITTGTVGGTSVVGYVAFSFSLRNRLDNVGVIDEGTAQSATSSTIVLRAAVAYADDELNGATVWIISGTGAGQSRVITDYVSSTDTATVSPNWTTTPSGTIRYAIAPTPPAPTASAALPTVNMTQINGSTTPVTNIETAFASTQAEVTSVPASTAPWWTKVGFLFLKSRNKVTQTATTQTLFADDGSTTVGTSTVSDNGTTATRGEFS